MEFFELKPFGIEIRGLDLSHPRSAEVSAKLRALFDEHYLMIVRGQDLSDDDHLRVFQDLFPGADLDDETGTGSKISYVSNVRADGLFGDGPLSFHSDYSFTTEPTRLISLYGVDVAPGSAPTEFSNSEMALRSLPPPLRARIENREVVSATDLMSVAARLPRYNLPGREDLSGRSHEEVLRAAWPVIMRHPRTGRPLLYVNELHAHHLRGVPLDESRDILGELCEYLYNPDCIFSHEWAQGDFVLWDNIALSHGRRPTSASTAQRTLRRVRSGGASLPTMMALSQIGLEDQADGSPAGSSGSSPALQEYKHTLGRRVKQFRLANDWTQRDLSDAADIDIQLIERCELGNWLPPETELKKIAAALRVDLARLSDGRPVESEAFAASA